MLLLIPIVRRVVVLAAVLAVPAVGGELASRALVADAVKSAVQARIGVAPKVEFGSTPVLVQLVRGRLDTVDVSARGAQLGGLPPVALSATLRDVHLTHVARLAGAIGSLTVDARLGPAGVLELLATPSCVGALPADVRSALTAAPRVYLFPGRVDLLPPAGRSVEVRLAPAAAGGGVAFVLSGLDRGSAAASPAALALARARTRCTRVLPSLPFGVRLLSATALTGGLDLTFAGQNASFSAIG